MPYFNFAFYNMVFYGFYFFQAQGQGHMGVAYPHDIFSFAIPILLNILLLKYGQNQHQSPFQTHPQTVLSGILSLLFYCLAFDFQHRFRNFRVHGELMLASFFHRCVLFFGYMAMATSASLICADSVGPVFYVLHVTLSVGDLLFMVFQRIRRRFGGARFRGRPNSPLWLRLWRALAPRNNFQGHLLPL